MPVVLRNPRGAQNNTVSRRSGLCESVSGRLEWSHFRGLTHRSGLCQWNVGSERQSTALNRTRVRSNLRWVQTFPARAETHFGFVSGAGCHD